MSDWYLVGIQFILLVLQTGCFLYGIHENKKPLEVLYGFSIWGSIPNIMLMLIVIFN